MKKLKSFFVFTALFFSSYNWSSSEIPISQACSLSPATQSCKQIYDSFLTDILAQVKSQGESFNKEHHIAHKIDHAQNELETAKASLARLQQQRQRQADRPKVLAKTPTHSIAKGVVSTVEKIGDFFWMVLKSSLATINNLLDLFWSPDEVAQQERSILDSIGLEQPASEEIEVGQDNFNANTATDSNQEVIRLNTKINDLNRQIAMYKEILLTAPAIGDDGNNIYKFAKYWNISNKDFSGVRDTKELKAFSVMLTWLDVDYLSVKLSEEFAKTDYSIALSEFQNAILNHYALTSLSLSVDGLMHVRGDSAYNASIQLAKKTYSPFFASSLARKNLHSNAESDQRAFKTLNLRGLYGVNEFLENFVSHEYFLTYLDWSDPFSRVPHFDSLSLSAWSQEEPLSENSLKTLEGLLINGLKDLNFTLEMHQQEKGQEPPRMLTKMYSDLFDPSITMGKTLALQSLTLASVTDEDAAAFVRYLATNQNNLEELTLYGLKEVNHVEKLLDALTEIYSNEDGFNPAESSLKLKALSYKGERLRVAVDKVRENNMSRFLSALATSPEARQLHELTISGNGLTDDNITLLAELVQYKKYLCPSLLDLSWNNISLEGAKVLAESIKQACDKKVKNLDFTGNFEKAEAKKLIQEYKDIMAITVY